MISSMFMKTLEYLILPYIKEHCNISRFQFGYRPNTSTSFAVATLKEAVRKYNSEGSPVYACFLDMSRAFERINLDRLMIKLESTSLPRFIINALDQMLSNGSAKVTCHGHYSAEWNITQGARQGGVLSAPLFIVYIDQLLSEISKENHGCYLGIQKMNCQAYADDFVLFCPTAGGLRVLLSKFSTLCDEHSLKINTAKTKIMIFYNKDKCHSDVNFTINNEKIEIVKQYKYLGSILMHNLRENEDINRLQSSFNRKVGMFNRKFHSVELNVKLKLFNSLCMDMFGMDLWCHKEGCLGLIKQLGVSYHYALKKMLGFPKRESNHHACYLLGQLTLEHLMIWRNYMFFKRLIDSNSPCMDVNWYYFRNNSYLAQYLDRMFKDKYQVENFYDNDADALKSRLFYVQNREPSSWNNEIG